MPKGFSSSKPVTFPCMEPRLVTAVSVIANDYNPNKTALPELDLLALSIREDGVTQGIVVTWDEAKQVYCIVDGFHRFTVLTSMFNCALVPVVAIKATENGRTASTIRHNRARGEHRADLMADVVEALLQEGVTVDDIATWLGMELEETFRLLQLNKIP